ADPALGLRLGRHVAARRLGLVGYVMAMSRNLGDALDRLSRYYAILREGVECRIDRGVESVTITLRDRSDVDTTARQQVDARLAGLIAVCRELTGHGIVPEAVDVPYDRPAHVVEHRRTFGPALLRFNRPQPALILSTTSLAHSLPTVDGTLFRYLQRLADDVLADLGRSQTGSFAGEVTEALTTVLAS